jgi:hypothetical protein
MQRMRAILDVQLQERFVLSAKQVAVFWRKHDLKYGAFIGVTLANTACVRAL